MIDKKTSIKRFEDLEVWRDAQALAVSIYKMTENFPDDEKFGMTSQIKRSSSSVSANIAEGFGRKGNSEKIQFYRIAYGSLLETKNFVYLAQKLNYIDAKNTEQKISYIEHLQKQLNGIFKYLGNNV